MRTIQSINGLKAYIAKQKSAGQTIGLVPTMGSLHEGHVSLIRESTAQNDCTVVSVFVNPTQFAPTEDFNAYPRDLDADARAAFDAGADVLFAPTAEDMYPFGFQTYVTVEGLSTRLCGKSRPAHFRGVTTVVCKLFGICEPNRAYFGQKDAQQLLVLQRMTQDLNISVELIRCPIVREPDGLAMSSRNVYLSGDQRKRSTALNRSLQRAQALIENGERSAAAIRAAIQEELTAAAPNEIDYIELTDAQTLTPLTTLTGSVLIALAVKFGSTRLIDNILLNIN